MTPQVELDGRERATTAPPAARTATSATRELTDADRQGLAMAWVGMALGTFLLLGGLALWAAAAFGAGFGGWLIGVGAMGVVMVATIVAVSYFVIRPRR